MRGGKGVKGKVKWDGGRGENKTLFHFQVLVQGLGWSFEICGVGVGGSFAGLGHVAIFRGRFLLHVAIFRGRSFAC